MDDELLCNTKGKQKLLLLGLASGQPSRSVTSVLN